MNIFSFDDKVACQYGVNTAILVSLMYDYAEDKKGWWTQELIFKSLPIWKNQSRLKRVLDKAVEQHVLFAQKAEGFTTKKLYKLNLALLGLEG